MNNKTALVIGGGKYGTKACQYFKEQKARVILVDNDPDCKAKAFVAKEDFVVKDAKDALELALSIKPDFIVPTHPGHTLGKWLAEYFHLKPLPDSLPDVMKRLPQSLIIGCDETNAALTSSYMTRGKLCREDCTSSHNWTYMNFPPEADPPSVDNLGRAGQPVPPFSSVGQGCPTLPLCALTGEPRPAPLYRLLEYAIFERFDCGRIFVAEQLAPGVGAIKASEFLAFMKEVEIKKPKTLAVGTACQCHGVLNLFRK